MNDSRNQIAIECDRIVHRLSTLPLHRIDAAATSSVHAAAQRIVNATPEDARPSSAYLPQVAPTGLSAQLAVVVRDYLNTTTTASEDAAVVKIVTDLRRSLP